MVFFFLGIEIDKLELLKEQIDCPWKFYISVVVTYLQEDLFMRWCSLQTFKSSTIVCDALVLWQEEILKWDHLHNLVVKKHPRDCQ